MQLESITSTRLGRRLRGGLGLPSRRVPLSAAYNSRMRACRHYRRTRHDRCLPYAFLVRDHMINVQPVRLEGRGIGLEPLTIEHHDALVAASTDGRLWELWFTAIPEPAGMKGYIADALKGHQDGHMLPWVVRELSSGAIIGTTRYHDIVPATRSRRDWVHVVRRDAPANACQYHLQATPARARVRHRRMQGRRAADRQLQFPLATGHRSAWRQEGRRAAALRPPPQRNRSRHGDVQHSCERVAGRATASRAAAAAPLERRHVRPEPAEIDQSSRMRLFSRRTLPMRIARLVVAVLLASQTVFSARPWPSASQGAIVRAGRSHHQPDSRRTGIACHHVRATRARVSRSHRGVRRQGPDAPRDHQHQPACAGTRRGDGSSACRHRRPVCPCTAFRSS